MAKKTNLVELLKQHKYEKLEKELKKIYPQIDYIEWEACSDGDTILHIVFVSLPYMLPFSGSSFAHFAHISNDSKDLPGLEEIMAECRVIEKGDIYNKNSQIEVGHYIHDLENRGYNTDNFDFLDVNEYNDAMWKTIKEIKNKECL